ncbi:uncharacterized protein WCC33_009480 [Rhinophrynus dorsalis]
MTPLANNSEYSRMWQEELDNYVQMENHQPIGYLGSGPLTVKSENPSEPDEGRLDTETVKEEESEVPINSATSASELPDSKTEIMSVIVGEEPGPKTPLKQEDPETSVRDSAALKQPRRSSAAMHRRGRIRALKFTEEEIEILINGVIDNYSKLFGQLCFKTSTAEKNRIWNRILRDINDLGHASRTTEMLKKRWTDSKRKLKRKLAHLARESRRNGTRLCEEQQLTPYEKRMNEAMSTTCPPVGVIGLIDTGDLQNPSGPSYNRLCVGEESSQDESSDYSLDFTEDGVHPESSVASAAASPGKPHLEPLLASVNAPPPTPPVPPPPPMAPVPPPPPMSSMFPPQPAESLHPMPPAASVRPAPPAATVCPEPPAASMRLGPPALSVHPVPPAASRRATLPAVSVRPAPSATSVRATPPSTSVHMTPPAACAQPAPPASCVDPMLSSVPSPEENPKRKREVCDTSWTIYQQQMLHVQHSGFRSMANNLMLLITENRRHHREAMAMNRQAMATLSNAASQITGAINDLTAVLQQTMGSIRPNLLDSSPAPSSNSPDSPDPSPSASPSPPLPLDGGRRSFHSRRRPTWRPIKRRRM